MEYDSLTILKYKLGDSYGFRVLDKFDVEDEPKRLDRMMEVSHAMKTLYGDDYTQLWIKTCPIFPTK